jgi:hypothetical protein
MATPPASTKSSLQQRLTARARTRWPQITQVGVRFRARFAYVAAALMALLSSGIGATPGERLQRLSLED